MCCVQAIEGHYRAGSWKVQRFWKWLCWQSACCERTWVQSQESLAKNRKWWHLFTIPILRRQSQEAAWGSLRLPGGSWGLHEALWGFLGLSEAPWSSLGFPEALCGSWGSLKRPWNSLGSLGLPEAAWGSQASQPRPLREFQVNERCTYVHIPILTYAHLHTNRRNMSIYDPTCTHTHTHFKLLTTAILLYWLSPKTINLFNYNTNITYLRISCLNCILRSHIITIIDYKDCMSPKGLFTFLCTVPPSSPCWPPPKAHSPFFWYYQALWASDMNSSGLSPGSDFKVSPVHLFSCWVLFEGWQLTRCVYLFICWGTFGGCSGNRGSFQRQCLWVLVSQSSWGQMLSFLLKNYLGCLLRIVEPHLLFL